MNDRSSARRPGCRTQRIKARLLLVAQRIVESRESGLHSFCRAKGGVESLLHRLDRNCRGQRLVSRTIDLEPFRRPDRCIFQCIERGAPRKLRISRPRPCCLRLMAVVLIGFPTHRFSYSCRDRFILRELRLVARFHAFLVALLSLPDLLLFAKLLFVAARTVG